MSEVQQQVQNKQTIKRKKKASTNAIREIKNEQKSTKNLHLLSVMLGMLHF